MDDACWARVDGIRLSSVCGAVGLRSIWQCVESGLRVGDPKPSSRLLCGV